MRGEVLLMLSEMPGADAAVVGRVMRAHIAPVDPARRIARDYLLQQAQRRRRDEWPLALFYAVGATEDRFLALQVMGRIESEHTLECAGRLANDRSWSPDSTGLVSCGTIAMSVESFEGPVAASLLLLLAKDPRFTTADEGKVRDATRTWHETDLRTYVKILDLTDRDAAEAPGDGDVPRRHRSRVRARPRPPHCPAPNSEPSRILRGEIPRSSPAMAFSNP